MGASHSTKKKKLQGEQGGTHKGHSSSSSTHSCPPTTSSADTASQIKQTLIGLKERLTSQRQTTREVQRPRESRTMMESQTMRVDQPTTVTPSDNGKEVPTCSVPEPTEPTQSPVSDLIVPAKAKKTNMKFFYQDAKGDIQGPNSEERMQEWYRKGYFTSKILIGIGQKEQLVPFSTLLAENGSSTPFAYAKETTSISESYAVSLSFRVPCVDNMPCQRYTVLTHRPWYLIPMLHPIAVPSQMLVTGEKLVDEVEKLREKFFSRNMDSLDEVLSHLLKRSISCELCSTTLFNSRSEFVAHILSRQHHEELWENRSGVTKHDIDYWNYVLDLARPSEGPNEEHAKMLLNGRLRDEDGKLLYRQNVTNVPLLGTGKEDAVEKSVLNEAQTVPSKEPKDCIQKPMSSVQPLLTWSYFTSVANETPKKTVTKNDAMIQSELLRIRLEAWKRNTKKSSVTNEAQTVSSERPTNCIQKPTSAVQPVQTWSSVVANGNPQATPTITFTQQKQNFPSTKSTKATKNVVLTNPQRKKIRLQEAAKRNAEAKAKYPLVPTSCPFFKLANTGTGLPKVEVWSACITLREVYFSSMSPQLTAVITRALLPIPITHLDFFICPICNVQLQHGRPFVEHTMGIRHIEKLYSMNGAITQQDVEFWNETIQQELHRNE